ncbi:MAG: hypothetical protein ACI8QD_001156 [Cyclobacteriaceae bacterium]|jgi:hypothetical protein
MKYYFCILVFISFINVHCFAQSDFPPMEAESLTNQFINLPEDITGKYTLIGLAFSKKSEEYLNSWFNPAYQQFIYKPETPSLFAGGYDINVYFVPMFTGAKRPAYQKVMDKIRKTIDPKLQPHVLFYKGTLKSYKDVLNFDGKNVPYFYVVNPEGKIVYSTTGAYSDRKMSEIQHALEASWN